MTGQVDGAQDAHDGHQSEERDESRVEREAMQALGEHPGILKLLASWRSPRGVRSDIVQSSESQRTEGAVRRWGRRLLLGALIVWGAWAFADGLLVAFREPPAPLEAPPSHWSLRAPAVAELEGFAREIDRALPAGRRIAVGRRGLSPAEDFFLSLWLAYVLPRHDVLRARLRWPLDRADYLLLHRSSLDDYRPEAVEAVFARPPRLVLEHPAGTLYRISRP